MSREQDLTRVLQQMASAAGAPAWLRYVASAAVASDEGRKAALDSLAKLNEKAEGRPIAFPANAHVVFLENFGGNCGPIFLETELLHDAASVDLPGAIQRAERLARGSRWLVCKVTPVAASGPDGWQIVGEDGAAPVVTSPSGHGPESRL